MKITLRILLLMTICLFYAQPAFSIDLGAVGVSKPVKNFKQIKNQYVIRQTLDYSCGPAALATLLSYYFQDKVTEDQIIKALIVTSDLEKVKRRKGFSLLDLKNFAKLRGYEVVGYRMDLEYLASFNKPVLVPIDIKDYSHFVIFRGLKGDRVFLSDPALGKMTMKSEKFLRLWSSGVGLVLSKSGKVVRNTPLNLTAEEKAVFADPALVRKIFGVDPVGMVHGDGEF